VLDGAMPVLMAADPPYGVSYDPAWRHGAGLNRSKRSRGIRNDDRADWHDAWALFPGDVAFIWHSALHSNVFYDGLVSAGFEIRAQIIWFKSRFAIGRGDYQWAHEPAFYAVRKGRSAHWCGDRKQSTVWQIASVSGHDENTEHPTQKPIECMKRPILNNTKVGEGVYDPFLGSGTTLVAAERCGRICYAIEIDPRFIDVSIRRWQTLTGKDALLAGTEKTFDEIAAERKRNLESAASDKSAERRIGRQTDRGQTRRLTATTSLRGGRR
jgi:DNA modification methylase